MTISNLEGGKRGTERKFPGFQNTQVFYRLEPSLTAIYGRVALFVRLVVELTIKLYGVWMFDVRGGKWFIFNVATEEVNNRYPSRLGQIAHIWCQGPEASPTSLYSIWSEYWEELTDFVASALSVLRVDFTSHDGRARARISPGAVLTSKWGGEENSDIFL